MKTGISFLGYKIYRLLLLTISQKSITEWPIKQTNKWTRKQDIEQVTDTVVKAREKNEAKTKSPQQQKTPEKAKRFSHRDNLQLPIQENPVVWFCNFWFHLNVKSSTFISQLLCDLNSQLDFKIHSTDYKQKEFDVRIIQVVLHSDSVVSCAHFPTFHAAIEDSHLDTEGWGSEQYCPNPISTRGMETVISWKDSTSVSHMSCLLEQCFCSFIVTKSLLFQSMTFTIISLQSMTISGQ